MLFAIQAKDNSEKLELRLSTRDAHVAYLKGLGPKLVLAGPLLDTNEKPFGSIVVLKVDSLAEAQAIADDDPYAKAGVFETCDVSGWNWTINRPADL